MYISYVSESSQKEEILPFSYVEDGRWESDSPIETFTGINNYEMPAYIRLDLGCSIEFKASHPQSLTLGVYNVLNRHNPFSVIYDDRSREWRQVSLIPIMPSFSYRISF